MSEILTVVDKDRIDRQVRLSFEVAKLRTLAEAVADWYLDTYLVVDQDPPLPSETESEIHAYCVATGRIKPDPADDPSIGQREGR